MSQSLANEVAAWVATKTQHARATMSLCTLLMKPYGSYADETGNDLGDKYSEFSRHYLCSYIDNHDRRSFIYWRVLPIESRCIEALKYTTCPHRRQVMIDLLA